MHSFVPPHQPQSCEPRQSSQVAWWEHGHSAQYPAVQWSAQPPAHGPAAPPCWHVFVSEHQPHPASCEQSAHES